MISEWQDSIARPDLADWVTVTAYFITAVATVRAASVADPKRQPGERLFWRNAALALILLALNELLDLQTLLTSISRAHGQANGWYEWRRTVQYGFVAALGGAILLAGIALLRLLKQMHAAVGLALAGFVCIGLFVLARAASFHHLDEVLGSGPAMFHVDSMQEMAGILVVAVAAALYIKTHRPTG